MNVNTIAGYLNGTGRNQWTSQAIAATTETAFTIGTDSGTPAVGFVTPSQQSAVLGGVSPLSPNVNAAALNANIAVSQFNAMPDPPFNTGSFDGRLLRIRMSGVGNAGANAAQSVLVKLYQGTSTTLGSDTNIGSTGAALATVAGGAFSFFIEAVVLWDSTSQIMSGFYHSNVNFTNKAGSQTVTEAALLNYPSFANPSGISFLGSVTFGNAAASTVQLREFSVDVV